MCEQNTKSLNSENISFFRYLNSELNRGYLLENDEERYTARREKVYAFFKIPLEIEKFIIYGFLQCADSLFFVLTFLPIRFVMVLFSLLIKAFKILFSGRSSGWLTPAEKVDILKVILLVVCFYVVSFIDTSVCYHMIKTQSTIKLYLFFNMLEIADRLMSAFGQDTLDALFWTATEPADRKKEKNVSFHLFHFIVAPMYVALHSVIVLMQALTLNVAINSDNKGLLSIVISNNFVELKGAVFKKFDRNNLLQIACSDVRERFHYCVLLFVVVIQTMKEYSWKEDRLYILLPDCLLIFWTEVLIDWVKHAFVTRFNDIPIAAYRDYNILIASDLIVCKQKNAYSDHSDLVARRMGFIPLPLSVVVLRVLSQALSFSSCLSYILFVLGFLCILTTRILVGIVTLGKACALVENCEVYPRSRNVSECISNDLSTPHTTKRRTISRELKEKLTSNTFRVPSIDSETKSHPPEKEPTLIQLPNPIPTLDYSPQKENFTEPPSPEEPTSLGFLGESRSGLMTNSMVNISSLGLHPEDEVLNDNSHLHDESCNVEDIGRNVSVQTESQDKEVSEESVVSNTKRFYIGNGLDSGDTVLRERSPNLISAKDIS